jgi:hypothetical protein
MSWVDDTAALAEMLADVIGEQAEAVRADPSVCRLIEIAAPGFRDDLEAVLAAIDAHDIDELASPAA